MQRITMHVFPHVHITQQALQSLLVYISAFPCRLTYRADRRQARVNFRAEHLWSLSRRRACPLHLQHHQSASSRPTGESGNLSGNFSINSCSCGRKSSRESSISRDSPVSWTTLKWRWTRNLPAKPPHQPLTFFLLSIRTFLITSSLSLFRWWESREKWFVDSHKKKVHPDHALVHRAFETIPEPRSVRNTYLLTGWSKKRHSGNMWRCNDKFRPFLALRAKCTQLRWQRRRTICWWM